MSCFDSHWWILGSAILLGCLHRAEIPEPIVEEPIVEVPIVEEQILDTEGPRLDPSTRQQWPAETWTRARAYTYNFVPYGPGQQLRVWDENGWSEAIVQTFELSQKQAELAVELTHRSQGDILASKCAFPRHAVVFFDDQENPLASINICFECTDILVWPPYFEDEALNDSKYETAIIMGEGGETLEMPLIFTIHEGLLSDWERYFELAGAGQFTR